MAFLVQETSFYIGCDNDFDSAFLMSFLEEPAGQEYNNEELDRLMRSLEAEINPNIMGIDDPMMEPESSCDDIGCVSDESVDLDFQWADMEPMLSPESSEGMNWQMDTQREEIDALTEIGDNVSDLSFGGVLDGNMYTTSPIELEMQ